MTPHATEELLEFVERERARMPRSALEVLVLESYRRGSISAGRAAELLDVRLEEFLRTASKAGIAVFDASPEELAADADRATPK